MSDDDNPFLKGQPNAYRIAFWKRKGWLARPKSVEAQQQRLAEITAQPAQPAQQKMTPSRAKTMRKQLKKMRKRAAGTWVEKPSKNVNVVDAPKRFWGE